VTESLNVDHVYAVISDPVSHQRTIYARRHAQKCEATPIAWSRSRFAITTSGLSVVFIDYHPNLRQEVAVPPQRLVRRCALSPRARRAGAWGPAGAMAGSAGSAAIPLKQSGVTEPHLGRCIPPAPPT
jgi:hypothetical protein